MERGRQPEMARRLERRPRSDLGDGQLLVGVWRDAAGELSDRPGSGVEHVRGRKGSVEERDLRAGHGRVGGPVRRARGKVEVTHVAGRKRLGQATRRRQPSACGEGDVPVGGDRHVDARRRRGHERVAHVGPIERRRTCEPWDPAICGQDVADSREFPVVTVYGRARVQAGGVINRNGRACAWAERRRQWHEDRLVVDRRVDRGAFHPDAGHVGATGPEGREVERDRRHSPASGVRNSRSGAHLRASIVPAERRIDHVLRRETEAVDVSADRVSGPGRRA
jgi:hypothetical protein